MTQLIYILIISIFSNASNSSHTHSKHQDFEFEAGALAIYRSSNRGAEVYSEKPNGLGLQEVSFGIAGEIDSYWRFFGAFSLAEEAEVDTTTTPPTRTSENVFEAEEVFAETISFPYLTFKIGKFNTALGSHNQLHLPEYPFIDAPLINEQLLGEHGFNDTGISLSGPLHLPWTSELIIQAVSGRSEESTYFGSPSTNTVAGVGRWQNAWNISKSFDFMFGISGAQGENSQRLTTRFQGADFAFNWHQNSEQKHVLAFETLARQKNEATDERANGWASWIQYQISKSWWLQVRSEQLTFHDQDPASVTQIPSPQTKNSALIAFKPSNASMIRLQLDQLNDNTDEHEKRVLLQFGFNLAPRHEH